MNISKELFSENGSIYTKTNDDSPTKYSEASHVSNSLVANGCIIEGKVENSIIFRRVRIHEGVEISNCIIMQNCEIKSGAKLTNIIIDKNIVIDINKELKGDVKAPLVVEKKLNF
jgi:glucose-1-phosphate adenylyltransferase